MKRKITAIVITLCMALASILTLSACTPNGQEATTFVSIDINPSIELTLSARDKVVSVRGANEDGQVLLYGEADLKGMDVEQAVAKITELAVEYGYLNEDNKVAQVNVVGSARVQSVLSKVTAKIEATAQNLSLQVSCTGADAYSLTRQLDNLKAQYPNNQAIQSLTPAKLKLVISASETGEVSVEAGAEMDVSKLVEIVSNAHAQAEQYATEAYDKAKSIAQSAFEQLKATAIDGIYPAYFANHHALDAYYAISYYGYKVGAVAVNALADVILYADKASNVPLNAEQITAISKALGLGENVDALKNSQGEITVKSIEAYADKLFKNSQANADLQQIKAELTTALNSAESAIQAELDKLNAEYKTEIEQIKSSLAQVSNSIKTFISGLLPEEIKQQINSMTSDVDEIINKISVVLSDGKVTADEARELANQLSDKASASKKVMESKLSADERAEIAELQATAEAKLASSKAQMDEAIADAKAQAEAYLQQLKDARASK